MSEGRSLYSLLTQQRRFIYLAIGLLSAAGVWAALRLPSAIYPELAFPRITIVVQGSALGARQIVFAIARPIEEAVSIVPGVTRVQSRSIRGSSAINVTFAPDADMAYALQQTQARVNQIRSALPAGVDVEVERLSPALFPVLSYNLEGGTATELYDIAAYGVKPLISRVPGVGRVEVQGSDVREIEVVADPARLATQGMTYDDLATAIRKSTSVTAVGRVPQNYRGRHGRNRTVGRKASAGMLPSRRIGSGPRPVSSLPPASADIVTSRLASAVASPFHSAAQATAPSGRT